MDIRGGKAVHARGGQREEYEPVEIAAGERVAGDAVALARVYVDRLGVAELYVADLDAIASGVTSANAALLGQVAALGAPVWVDAGLTTPEAATSVIEGGASVIIVGLETLTSFNALVAICQAIGGDRVAFSVDFRNGVPVTVSGAEHSRWSAGEIARSATDGGVGSIIVLDLARVGSGSGVDLELTSAVRRAAPRVALFAGAGVRNGEDLDALARAGCDGALVATALLSGALRLT